MSNIIRQKDDLPIPHHRGHVQLYCRCRSVKVVTFFAVLAPSWLGEGGFSLLILPRFVLLPCLIGNWPSKHQQCRCNEKFLTDSPRVSSHLGVAVSCVLFDGKNSEYIRALISHEQKKQSDGKINAENSGFAARDTQSQATILHVLEFNFTAGSSLV